jgi:hypothetical protein
MSTSVFEKLGAFIMSKNLSKIFFVLAPSIVVCVLVIAWMTGPVYSQCCPKDSQGGQSSHQAAGHTATQTAGPADHPQGCPMAACSAHAKGIEEPPHGGQISEEFPYTFEVVYQPKEIRVYAYTHVPDPIAMNNVKGEIIFKEKKTAKTSKVSLKHVKPSAGSSVEEYLTADVDLSKVKDGARTVSIQLDDLPQPEHVKAAFTQTFALTKVKPKVTVAETGEADKAGIAKQKTCPVTGENLGSMGSPIKVLVGDKPLYLCCQGCVAKVKNDPEAYLAKVGQVRQSQ